MMQVFGRYTTREVAEKRLPDFAASDHYQNWWTVRELAPPAHLPEYKWAVVFEAPAHITAAQLLDRSPRECPHCDGNGEIAVNPGWPDPQHGDVVRCPVCRGSGRMYDEEAQAA